MKELMKTNVYDVGESVLIVGSCLPDMEPEGFAQLCASSGHVFELCLEQTHINMAITKISAMLYTGKIRTLRFATVDRSPHCVQMHYIQNELRRMMDLSAVTIENYVVENGKLTKLSPELIYLSKHLGELSRRMNENVDGRKCIRNPQDGIFPILRSEIVKNLPSRKSRREGSCERLTIKSQARNAEERQKFRRFKRGIAKLTSFWTPT